MTWFGMFVTGGWGLSLMLAHPVAKQSPAIAHPSIRGVELQRHPSPGVSSRAPQIHGCKQGSRAALCPAQTLSRRVLPNHRPGPAIRLEQPARWARAFSFLLTWWASRRANFERDCLRSNCLGHLPATFPAMSSAVHASTGRPPTAPAPWTSAAESTRPRPALRLRLAGPNPRWRVRSFRIHSRF